MFHTSHHNFSFQKNRVEMVVACCPEFHVHALPGVAPAVGINCCSEEYTDGVLPTRQVA